MVSRVRKSIYLLVSKELFQNFKISLMKEHEKSRQVARIKVSDVKFDTMYETRWTHSTLKTISLTHSSGNCLSRHKQSEECLTA